MAVKPEIMAFFRELKPSRQAYDLTEKALDLNMGPHVVVYVGQAVEQAVDNGKRKVSVRPEGPLKVLKDAVLSEEVRRGIR